MIQSPPAEDDSRPPTAVQRVGAEVIGTFFLTLVAAGADVIDFTTGGQIGHMARYLAPGFVVAAMIWSLSAISGTHINPAVTFTFVLRGCFPIARAFGYVVAQAAGAIAAAATLRWFFGPALAAGAPHPGPGVSQVTAMGWEAMLTALLVLVILGTAEQPAVVGKNAALAVGITVAACGLFSSPVSGASMNPARAFGPQLLNGDFDIMWVYIVGPLLGAAIAAIIIQLLVGTPKYSEREASRGKSQ